MTRNLDKVKEDKRKWAAANREKMNEWKRKWYSVNKERVKEYNHKYHASYYLANMDKVNEDNMAWKVANPDKRKRIASRWATDHPDNMRKNWMLRRARKLLAPGNGITEEQAKQLFEEYNYQCAYCGSGDDLSIDHIEPLSRGGAHDISNAVVACRPCNRSKSNKPLLMWMYGRIAHG